MKILNRIGKFIFSYDWEIVEIQGSIFKITWGIWLLLPFDTFRTVQGYNNYGNENYWGVGLLALGIIHFGTIVSHNIKARKTITFVAFLFWLFSALMIAMQSLTAGIIPMFGVIAFFMGVNFIRLGRMVTDRRKEDLGPPNGDERRDQ